MEHFELVAEMPYIEKLSTHERLKLARRRRIQQLKKYSQREKEMVINKKEKNVISESKLGSEKLRKNNKISFTSEVTILEAAARNDIEEVKQLLEAGVDPDCTNEDGLTALHQCCIDDSEEMMRILVFYGADVNAQDSEKWTPLHAAATCGHLHLAKFLITKGANLLAVNADGNMPYDICEDDATLDYIENEMASRGVTQQLIDDTRSAVERQMLKELKQMKVDGRSLMCRDEHGATPLHIAAANGYVLVVEYLISQNIPVEVQDNDDWSPLHAAACWGHPEVLELLALHGANLQAKTKNNETPYDICEDSELQERIVQLINEIETKRINDQNKRIRRVRSNKRAQSIRRTSIREKVLTPKKDVQDEARLMLRLQNEYFNRDDTTTNSDVESSNENNLDCSFTEKNSVENDQKFSSLKLYLEEHEAEVKRTNIDDIFKQSAFITENNTQCAASDNNSITRSDQSYAKNNFNDFKPNIINPSVKEDSSPRVNVTLSTPEDVPKKPLPPPRSSSTKLSTSLPHISTSSPLLLSEGEENVQTASADVSSSKIDIHVTVTLNPFSPGTLQDLKRQRALNRASQSSVTLSSNAPFSLNSGYCNTKGNIFHSPVITCEQSAGDSNSSVLTASTLNPSPLNPRKFRAEPTDVIGKDRVPCCGLM